MMYGLTKPRENKRISESGEKEPNEKNHFSIEMNHEGINESCHKFFLLF